MAANDFRSIEINLYSPQEADVSHFADFAWPVTAPNPGNLSPAEVQFGGGFGVARNPAGYVFRVPHVADLTLAQRLHLGRAFGTLARGEYDQNLVAAELRPFLDVLDQVNRVRDDGANLYGDFLEYVDAVHRSLTGLQELAAPIDAPEPLEAPADADEDLFEVVNGVVGDAVDWLNSWSLSRFGSGGWQPPVWLEFTAETSRWLGNEDLPARVQRQLAAAPERYVDCCAYLALASAGVGVRKLGKPEDWRLVTGGRLLEFLRAEVPQPWNIYDATARLVASGGAPKKNKRAIHLVAGCGHLAAVWTRQRAGTCPIALRPPAVNDLRAEVGFRYEAFLGAHLTFSDMASSGPLRGPNGLEVDTFYRKCKIRPAVWETTKVCRCDKPAFVAGYDLTAAYPSILQSRNCIFPRSCEQDRVEEFETPKRLPLDQNAFMHVTLKGQTERAAFGRGASTAWVWGAALARVRPADQPVECWGVYRCSSTITGRAYERGVSLKLDEAVDAYAAQTGQTPERAIRDGLVLLTGVLEAAESTRVRGVVEEARIPAQEQQYLEQHYRHPDPQSGEDLTLWVARGSEEGTRELRICTRSNFRATGRLAKLAIYSYTAAKIAEFAYAAGRTPDLIRTDAVYWVELTPQQRASVEFYAAIDNEWHAVDGLEIGGNGCAACRPHAPLPIGFKVLPPPCPETTKADLTNLLEDGLTRRQLGERLPSRLWLSGAAGVGKTYFARTVLEPLAAKLKLEVVYATPTRDFADAQGWPTLQEAFAKRGADIESQRRRAWGQMIIIDEAGLSQPGALRHLRRIAPRVLVLIGDAGQLHSVDIARAARLLECTKVELPLHANDRYSGCPRFHSVLRLARRLALSTAQESRESCPEVLVEYMADQGVSVRPLEALEWDQAAGDVILGWRHKVLKNYRGGSETNTAQVMTVHASQGRTLEAPVLHIVDFRRANVRLLYTALTRIRSLDQLRLYTDA